MLWLSKDVYDIKALKKYLVILAGYAALSYITKGWIYVLLPAFVITALAKEKLVDLLFWVMILCFTGVSNPYVFPKTIATFIIARLSLFLLAVILMMRVFGRRNARIVAPFAGIYLYIFWECVVSAQGFEPTVSYMKLILFIPIYMALYGIANEITASSRVNAKAIRSAILSIVCMIVYGSSLMLPFPSISQLNASMMDSVALAQMLAEDKSLFMGITNQSQALGPMLGVMLSVVFGDLVFSVKRWDALYVSLLVIGAFLIVKTSSRTGMGTFIAGLMMVTWLFMRARTVGVRWKFRVITGMGLTLMAGFIAVLAIPGTRDRMLGFVLKVNAKSVDVASSDVTFENFTSSRQGLAERAMYNFRKKPLLGNGFQVSDTMQGEHRSGILDYMSAPIEKGFWPAAILEEGGVVGLVLFAGFLISTIYTLVIGHAYIGATALWVFVVVNMGEFNFFSMSYTGGFEWALVFAAIILDGQRMKNVGLELWDVPIEQVIEEVGYEEWERRRA